MSELQESIIRSQVLILLHRNQNKSKKIIKRFLQCLNGEYNEAKKIINKT